MVGRGGMVRRRGLGYNPVIGPGGKVIDCDLFWTMITNPGTCFNLFATDAPVTTGTDPTTGQPVVTPDVQAAANAMNKARCGLFQTLQSDGTCGTDWTTLTILGAGGILLLVLLRRI